MRRRRPSKVRSQRWRVAGSGGAVLGALLVLASGASCSSASTPTPNAAAQLPTHNHTGKPPLVVIEREGDPFGALGIAAHLPHGSAALGQLAAAAVSRLSSRGLVAKSTVSQDALLLAVQLPRERPPSEILNLVRQALFDAPLAAPQPSPPLFDPCGFGEHTSTAAAARAALGHESVALAVVGDEDLVEVVTEAYADASAWPSGELAADPWPEQDQWRRATASGLAEVSVALRTAEVERVASAARAVAAPDSLVNTLARAGSPAYRVLEVSSTLRPRGACLSVRLAPEDSARRGDPSDLLTSIGEELGRAVTRAPQVPVQSATLRTSDPSRTAITAAWAALAGRFEADEPRLVVTATSAEAPHETAVLQGELRTRVERGQGRIWAALSSACPTDHEQLASAGHTALALAAAAHAGSGDPRVAIEAHWSERGLALIASADAELPDAAEQLAEGMARSLLAASSKPELAAFVRDSLASAPLEPPSLSLALRLASGGNPSRLLPHGTFGSLPAFDRETARAALRGFLGSPLTLSVLANASPEQAASVQARLFRLLGVLAPEPHTCHAPEPSPAVGGEYLLSEPAGELATIVVPLPQPSAEAARWAAALLDGPGGWLEHALLGAGLALGARAHGLGQKDGPAALVITLEADPHALPDAIMQTRALLQRMSERRLTTLDLERISRRLADARDASDPRTRVLSLSWGDSTLVDAARLQSLLRALDDEALIVVRPIDETP